jgi:hypothetical protein
LGKVVEELLEVEPGGLAVHVSPGDGVGEQLGVGVEEAPALGDEAVVAGVEAEEAAGVHLGERGVVGEAPAPGLEAHQVRLVQLRVHVGVVVGAGEVVEAVAEEAAVRGAQCVAAGEHGQVLDAEALGTEHLEQAGEVGRGRGQLVRLVGDGHAAVAAAQRDGPSGAIGEHHGVTRRERKDVGAGHDARARHLQPLLDALHRPEPAGGQVRRPVLLCRVALRRVQKHRTVAPLHHTLILIYILPASNNVHYIDRTGSNGNAVTYPDEAVVEMESEQRTGQRRRLLEDLQHLIPDDLLHLRARLAVEIRVQPSCCSQGSRRRRDQHNHHQCRHPASSDERARRHS